MSRTRGWTGLLTSVVALALVASATTGARAATMSASDSVPVSTLLAYNTVGSTIGTTGVTGDASALQFVPVTGGALTPSSLSLAVFQTKALADGHTVTFNNTPFDIKFTATGVNGSTTAPMPNTTPIDITGTISGTLNGPNQSSVVATFTPLAQTFVTGLYQHTLTIPNSPLTIVPSTTNNGVTTAQGFVSTTLNPTNPVPEPSTILLFSATIIGLGFRHRARKAARDAG